MWHEDLESVILSAQFDLTPWFHKDFQRQTQRQKTNLCIHHNINPICHQFSTIIHQHQISPSCCPSTYTYTQRLGLQNLISHHWHAWNKNLRFVRQHAIKFTYHHTPHPHLCGILQPKNMTEKRGSGLAERWVVMVPTSWLSCQKIWNMCVLPGIGPQHRTLSLFIGRIDALNKQN